MAINFSYKELTAAHTPLGVVVTGIPFVAAFLGAAGTCFWLSKNFEQTSPAPPPPPIHQEQQRPADGPTIAQGDALILTP